VTGEPPSPAASPFSAKLPTPGGPGADLRDIVSPLPGTFYRAPQPGAPPFAEVGGDVEPNTVVAIIETMKLMNPVYAGMAGTVAQICLDDGQFAEQGTALMRVRPRDG
jgi:acetyl-CoA carboxylase biotin carboxyl carrier protein